MAQRLLEQLDGVLVKYLDNVRALAVKNVSSQRLWIGIIWEDRMDVAKRPPSCHLVLTKKGRAMTEEQKAEFLKHLGFDSSRLSPEERQNKILVVWRDEYDTRVLYRLIDVPQ